MTTTEPVREAFAAAINLGHFLREVEFLLGLLPEKPRERRIDFEAVQVQLIDARGALGQISLHLAEIHAAQGEEQ